MFQRHIYRISCLENIGRITLGYPLSQEEKNIIFLKTPEASFMLRGPWAQITHMVAPGLQQPPLL